MRTKKKKQSSNKTLPLLIIAVLIGLMAYKYRLLDEKFLKGLPDIIPTEQTSALPSSAPADALEIPVMQSRTGGQLIKRKGYTLSYNADYKTPQWVAWELTGKETKGKEERTDKYNATIPYYGDSQCIIVNDDSDYKTSDDLKGKTVGCTNGQAAQTIIEDMAKEKGFTVKLYEDSAVGMNDLKLGRIDAYANTTTNVNAFTHNNTDAKFRFFDEQLLANNVAYFLPKTDDGEKLTKELNDVIQEMLDDGTVAKITEKWMYADMTKLIQK